MKAEKRILRPVGKGNAGIYVPRLKNTAETLTEVMPTPSLVKIPMSQHIGIPAKPIVSVGNNVFVGTIIAKADGEVSAPVHSSVSGIVKEIVKSDNDTYIVIESDGKGVCDPELKPFEINSAKDIIAAAEACGLVGLGGAGFPTKIKLTVKDGQKVEYLIVNVAECEPYITSDYRECMEAYDDVIEGIYLLKKALQIEKVVVCIEGDKRKAIEKLYEAMTAKEYADDTVKLMRLPTKYPNGAERTLIYLATGKIIPKDKLPIDLGCIVMNVASIATLNRFVKTGMPLVSKRITVDGSAVSAPKNVIVPIGTAVQDVLGFVGVDIREDDKIIAGGPIMGEEISPECVIEKRNNAITVMKASKVKETVTACIRCGRCAKACPMKLYPAAIEKAVNSDNVEALKALNIDYCIECGCCSFVCPAKHSLARSVRLGKAHLKAVEQ